MAKMVDSLFIVILKYEAKLEQIDYFRSAHIEFLDQYYQKEIFIASGPKIPRNGGIIIAKSTNIQSLKEILKQDPFAINNLATYEIIEFSPTKYNNIIAQIFS